MEDQYRQEYREPEEQEIDLMELAQKLWAERRLIIKWGTIAAVIGLVVAFSIPKEYSTTVKLAPEITDGKSKMGGGLGALASMAGVNLGSGGLDAVYPDLYPDVVQSIPFSVGLFDVNVKESDGDTTITVCDYLENYTSSPWWGTLMSLPGKAIGCVMSLFKDDEEEGGDRLDPFKLTKEEDNIVEALGNRISVSVDSKSSVITISVTMQDPLVSAMLADSVAHNLKEYVTEYRTNKARHDMEYARQINEEARADYYAAQQKYAEYVDKNHGISLNSRRTEEERLRNEAQLAFSLYNSTAQQLQLARAKVQENTPVYAVIEPATVPVKPSKPRKLLILIGFAFVGVCIASAWILFGRGFKESFTASAGKES
ncbi:MAG: Wzz/FepE/Etk N-terminal domain-containing protein [Muribaculum sp.]|nr:Wzz/FepE/Etk N-terminal domain-containing protein [Muribaculum sp.]